MNSDSDLVRQTLHYSLDHPRKRAQQFDVGTLEITSARRGPDLQHRAVRLQVFDVHPRAVGVSGAERGQRHTEIVHAVRVRNIAVSVVRSYGGQHGAVPVIIDGQHQNRRPCRLFTIGPHVGSKKEDLTCRQAGELLITDLARLFPAEFEKVAPAVTDRHLDARMPARGRPVTRERFRCMQRHCVAGWSH